MGVMLNDVATVIQADVFASNGVVHVIDQVILPPRNLAEVATDAGFTSLVGAVGAADPGVLAALTGDNDLTVFAPTNDAFAAVSDVTATLDQAGLTSVLLYHVVPGKLTAADLTFDADDLFKGEQNTFFLETVNGADLRVDVTPMGVWLNETAIVSTPNVMARNGVIHVIDQVLLPPANLATVATEAGFSKLVEAVGAADPAVAAALTGVGPLTVFAPTDAAFDAISATVAGLDQATLTQVLLFHVVPGAVYASEVPLDTPIATANAAGDTVTVTADAEGNLFVNGARIVATNVLAGNGVIHVIDAVILPPAPAD
jgi:transforming growth factor-beta-induced protein